VGNKNHSPLFITIGVTQYYLATIQPNFERGQIFGLLGPNGAGKTTLIRMITGIFYPDQGEIFFDGKKFDPQLDVAKIGYMPEERGLYKKMKVGEQALYLAQLKGLDKQAAVEEICNHIALVNRGKKILDGTVQEIKQHYKQHQYSVSGYGIEKLSLDQAPFTVVSQKENTLVIQIAAQNNSSDVLRFLLDRNIQINAFQELLPSLNDIFIQLVGNTPTARTFEKI